MLILLVTLVFAFPQREKEVSDFTNLSCDYTYCHWPATHFWDFVRHLGPVWISLPQHFQPVHKNRDVYLTLKNKERYSYIVANKVQHALLTLQHDYVRIVSKGLIY